MLRIGPAADRLGSAAEGDFLAEGIVGADRRLLDG